MVSGVVLACVLLAIKGLVDIYLVIPMFLGRSLGGYLGANIVLKTHGHFLRIVFSTVIIGLAVKTLFF